MIDARFRPLAIWPHDSTPSSQRRSRYTFKASWQSTLKLLRHELQALGAKNIVIGAGFTDRDIRLDGWPRSDARTPAHPGIEISFDSPRGRLVYATDSCMQWEDNVRSIALGLESLRAVDRYGITKRGQQYAGFRELPSATSEPSADRGRELIREHGDVRAALRATHPDTGGDAADFAAVMRARELDAA